MNNIISQENSNVSPIKNKMPTYIKILIAFYVISLFLPSDTKGSDIGLAALVIGWLGLFQGIFAWYANPLWIFAVNALRDKKYKSAVFFSMSSVVLALQVILMLSMDWKVNFIDSEYVIVPGVGYYLWLSVLIATFLTSLYFFIKDKK